jgi:2'-5' RNA ligase
MDENEKIHKIWNELDFSCQMNEVKFSPIPHFSYMTFTEVLDPSGLGVSLEKLAGEIDSFDVQVNGLGVFKRETPVLYLPIVRTKELSIIHSKILYTVEKYISGLSEFYMESNWMPHITLAIRDITQDNISCAVDECMQFELSFRLIIDHVAILYMDDESYGIKHSFALNN